MTYIIRTSLWERIHTSMTVRPGWEQTLGALDARLQAIHDNKIERRKIGVIIELLFLKDIFQWKWSEYF
ncbi:MAG: hypothetical protein R2784_14605 [Saprospiraceae bacterium]